MSSCECDWKKSTFSGTGNCVEVLTTAHKIGVRQSRSLIGQPVWFTQSEWAAFVAGVKAGEFDLPHIAAGSTISADVAEALRLAEAATDGPWVVGHPHNVIAQRWRGPVVAEPTAVGNKHNDAAFIAWCREGVPALVAEVEQLRAQIAAGPSSVPVLPGVQRSEQ